MVTTKGIFALDGDEFEVEDNIWIVGSDDEVVVIDAAHEHEPIIEGIGGRSVTAILLTHGHNDHINAAPALSEATGAPLYLHPDDRMLWAELYPEGAPDFELNEGDRIDVGGSILTDLGFVTPASGRSPPNASSRRQENETSLPIDPCNPFRSQKMNGKGGEVRRLILPAITKVPQGGGLAARTADVF